jgi:uncharacterized protein YndB with AHSA1/START domain
MADSTEGFTFTRVFDATPQQVWRAWTDPDKAAQWWHPRGMTTPRESVSIDAKVGGTYQYTMVDDLSGEEYPTGGTYHEVIENKQLIFTWGTPGDVNAPVVTVTIEDLGELTRMTFSIEGVTGVSGDDSYYDGWESAIDNFAANLAAG